MWALLAAAAAAAPDPLCAWLRDARVAARTGFTSVEGPHRSRHESSDPSSPLPPQFVYDTPLWLPGTADCRVQVGARMPVHLLCMAADPSGEALDQRVGGCVGRRRGRTVSEYLPFTVWSSTWPRSRDDDGYVQVMQWKGHPASIAVFVGPPADPRPPR